MRLEQLGLLWKPRADGGDIIVTDMQERAFSQLLAALLEGEAASPDMAQQTAEALLSAPLMFHVRAVNPSFFAFTAGVDDLGAGARTLCLSNRDAKAVDPGAGGAARARVEPDFACTLALPAQPEKVGDAMLDPAASWGSADRVGPFAAEVKRAAQQGATCRLPMALLAIDVVAPADSADAAVLFPVRLAPPATGKTAADYLYPIRYILAFAARATHWAYVFSSADASLLQALTVEDARGKIGFDPHPGPEMPQGRASIAFVSDVPILLDEAPGEHFALHRRAGPRARRETLIARLPAPHASTLPQPAPKGSRLSEIHIAL